MNESMSSEWWTNERRTLQRVDSFLRAVDDVNVVRGWVVDEGVPVRQLTDGAWRDVQTANRTDNKYGTYARDNGLYESGHMQDEQLTTANNTHGSDK